MARLSLPERRLRKIWITRAQPGASATAERVRGLGFEAVIAPLLAVRPLGRGLIDLAGVGAIAFTSANGVAAFAARSAARRLPVFAVGGGTAAAARAAGFAAVFSADGDVNALATAIAAHGVARPVIHPGAAEPAGDLAASLTPHGIEVRSVAVYETVPAALSPEVRASFTQFYAVLAHSPKAASLLADILRETPAPRLRAFCLSPAVAAPLRGLALGRLEAAALPNEDALLNLLADRGF
jgi:uroporphyrinogen-III synthase